jgi:hypothetical protein
MANVTTNNRYWTLDTVAVINAVGVSTIIRRIVYYPAAVGDDAVIQEYSSAAALVDAMSIKAGPSDISPVTIDWGTEGRRFNGFKLSVIDGGSLCVYIGRG